MVYLSAFFGAYLGAFSAVACLSAIHDRLHRRRRKCAMCNEPAIGSSASIVDGTCRIVNLCGHHLREAAELHQASQEGDEE